jgi:anti-anti-sigma regulatory factor
VRTTPWRLLHAQTADQLFIAVEDRATHAAAHHAEPLVADFFDRDLFRPTIVIDLGACGWVDTAFAGWLLSVRQRALAHGGRVVVSRCSPSSRIDLDLLGVAAHFDFESAAAPDELRQTPIAVPYKADRQCARTIAQGQAALAARAAPTGGPAELHAVPQPASHESVT